MTGETKEVSYQATSGFLQALSVTGCTLAATVYLQGRVLLICADGGRLVISATEFARPMGLATRADGGELRLAVATYHDVVVLADAPLLAKSVPNSKPGEFEHLFIPRMTMYSGDIDAHEMAWAANRLFAANTRFSCIAEIDGRHSFTPAWKPPFVTQLQPEDRCHLNGLAVHNDRIAYATAFGRTDVARGWSGTRLTGGILMEVPSGRVVLDNLCMPHSPRVFDDELFVLDSGTGRVMRVDAKAGTGTALAELPGFTRGLDRLGDILFVGMSRRRAQAQERLPVQDKHASLFCGIAAVERKNGKVLGWVRFDDTYQEIFDLKVLPKFRRGAMMSTLDEGHRRALVMPGRAFWGEKLEDVQRRRNETGDI